MKKMLLPLLLLLSLIFHGVTYAQVLTPVPIIIETPQAGEAVQGIVPIRGKIAVKGTISIYFKYAGDKTATWFLIDQISEVPADGLLAKWNTSRISDGNYDIKIEVESKTSSPQIEIVNGIRVRNYTTIETITPNPFASNRLSSSPLPTSTGTMTATPVRTPTPPPPNPASISSGEIQISLGQGASIAAVFLLIFGIYQGWRKWRLKDY